MSVSLVNRVRADPMGPSTWAISTTDSPHASSRNTNTSKTVALRALWLVILLIHAICGAYYAFMALVYHTIPNSLLSSHMKANGLSINVSHFPFLVGFFGTCSAVHAALLSEMLINSARRRSLYFRSRVSKTTAVMRKLSILRKSGPTRAKIRDLSVVSSTQRSGSASRFNSTKESFQRAERIATQAWTLSFGTNGFFGVGGKHFALMFLIRETVETIIQSLQAYTLSKYVPRVWLNRSAVAFVVVNCWSTPAIHHLLPPVPRLELILCLLVDILLDMASSIGVPTALGAMYLPDYNTSSRNFEDAKWGDDAWVANLNSEFKQLFIQSWFDFATRALFVATMLLVLDDVKILAAVPIEGASGLAIRRSTTSRVVKISKRFEKLMHAGMIAWGFVILGLHSSSGGGEVTPIDCMVRVRPWLATKTACAAMNINCTAHNGMVGNAAELEALWSSYETRELRLVIIRNCPEVHIPESIQSFYHLAGFYIYSSTLVDWPASAALTANHHPELRQISIATVNMTVACGPFSSLPPGLIARDFPQTLGTVVLIEIPLDKLPADLPSIWPPGLCFILLGNKLAAVPDVLLRMNPARIDMRWNNIADLPATIFELPTLKWLEMSWNPIVELPEQVDPSPALLEFNFGYSKISTLPTWMTRESFLRDVKMTAPMTPLCTQLKIALDDDSKALASKLCA